MKVVYGYVINGSEAFTEKDGIYISRYREVQDRLEFLCSDIQIYGFQPTPTTYKYNFVIGISSEKRINIIQADLFNIILEPYFSQKDILDIKSLCSIEGIPFCGEPKIYIIK